MSIRRILVLTELDAESEITLRTAIELARALSSELILLYTYVFPGPPSPYSFHASASRAVHEQAVQDLLHLAESCGGHGIPRRCLARSGRAHDVVLQAAEEFAVDLIVVGRRSPHGLERVFIDHTAEVIARQATCAVLVVPVPSRHPGHLDAEP